MVDAGWSAPATTKALAELNKLLPSFPKGSFLAAVARYVDAKGKPPPKEVREQLDQIAGLSNELSSLMTRPTDSLLRYLSEQEAKFSATGLRVRLVNDLATMMAIAEMARREAESSAAPGRPVAAHTLLIQDLDAVLRAADQTSTRSHQSDLTLAFGIALSMTGERVADPAGTVKSALKTLRGKQ